VRDIQGEKAWCVACGAGAASSPLDQAVLPANISDAEIDVLAQQLIRAVKVG
jgi:hypothetical protein